MIASGNGKENTASLVARYLIGILIHCALAFTITLRRATGHVYFSADSFSVLTVLYQVSNNLSVGTEEFLTVSPCYTFFRTVTTTQGRMIGKVFNEG